MAFVKKNPWDYVELPKIEEQVGAKLIDSGHPLNFFWGKEYTGRYLLIFQYSATDMDGIINTPELSGIETYSKKNNNDGNFYLILSLIRNDEWEIFYALCNDLIESTKNAKDTIHGRELILNRLKQWQAFLKHKSKNILSEEEIKGLIGELYFMKHYLMNQYQLKDAIKFWQGPQGSSQDFIINRLAIEVKCRVGTTPPKVKISSIDQLTTELDKLILFVITIGKSTSDNPASTNLPNIVNYYKSNLSNTSPDLLEYFNSLLLNIGYTYCKEYEEYNYVITKCEAYQVKDEFPKIDINNIAKGVTDIRYNINLNHCSQYKINANDWKF